MPSTFVIVGASLTGATAAATLRQEGFDGGVILIGDETDLPYERPPLSKQYLRGEAPFEKALVKPAEFYETNRIDLRLGAAAARIEPGQRMVELTDGTAVQYDKLLIATGVRNRRPAIPGLDLPNVLSLRSRRDADAIRSQAMPGRKAAVIGTGFIGCEVAASLRQQGVAVVLVGSSPAPLYRVVGDEAGKVIAGIHRSHGVELLVNDAVTKFEGAERVERVVTRSGRSIACDFAVVGLGVEPAVDFLHGSQVAIDNGILVDEYCRTNVEGIFAAGDVANHWHPLAGKRMRVEHWQNAMQHGAAAARSMLGKGAPYEPVHWFWSDQYDLNLQYAGFNAPWDRVVVRGSLTDRNFIAFYLSQGRVNAVAGVNRGKDVRRAMPVVKARAAVDPRRLADDAIDIRRLLDESRD